FTHGDFQAYQIGHSYFMHTFSIGVLPSDVEIVPSSASPADDRGLANVVPSSTSHTDGQIITDDDKALLTSAQILKSAWRLKPDDRQICRALSEACGFLRDRANDRDDPPNSAKARLDLIRFATAAVSANPTNYRTHLALGMALLPDSACTSVRLGTV